MRNVNIEWPVPLELASTLNLGADVRTIVPSKYLQRRWRIQWADELANVNRFWHFVAQMCTHGNRNVALAEHAQLIVYKGVLGRAALSPAFTEAMALSALKNASKIVVLSGAGVSTSCGVRDFRSADDGLYAEIERRYELPDPQLLFDLEQFDHDAEPFFDFARAVMPAASGGIEASTTHRFIRQLEVDGKLLRNYTQNVDGIERLAGIERVVRAHGSFATATCRACGVRVDGERIRADVGAGRVPRCAKCGDGVLKPDITFFGEPLPADYVRHIDADLAQCDCLLVVGTSLSVTPISKLPHLIDARTPQLLINMEPVGPPHHAFDFVWQGQCDAIVQRIGELL
jgi:NAD-dependent protein deacetylase sirtuin 1